jgi:hypothetical protein
MATVAIPFTFLLRNITPEGKNAGH